jgi:hypothetical protein
MTLQGTVAKTGVLLLILLVAAAYTWRQAISGSPTLAHAVLIGAAIGGFLVAMMTVFIPKISPITAPIYAALEGLLLGAISAVFEAVYPGIAIQAVGLSFGVLAVMLFVYGTGIIRVTQKFKIARGDWREAIAVFGDLIVRRPKEIRHVVCLSELLKVRGRSPPSWSRPWRPSARPSGSSRTTPTPMPTSGSCWRYRASSTRPSIVLDGASGIKSEK